MSLSKVQLLHSVPLKCYLKLEKDPRITYEKASTKFSHKTIHNAEKFLGKAYLVLIFPVYFIVLFSPFFIFFKKMHNCLMYVGSFTETHVENVS